MLDRSILVARVVRDPELRQTKDGTPVTTLRVVVNRPGRDGEKNSTFMNVVVWGKQAETACQHIKKGRMIAIEGHHRVRRVEVPPEKVPEEGFAYEVLELHADWWRFLPSDGGRKVLEPPPPEEDLESGGLPEEFEFEEPPF